MKKKAAFDVVLTFSKLQLEMSLDGAVVTNVFIFKFELV